MSLWYTAVRRFHSGPPFNYTTYDIYTFNPDLGQWGASPLTSLSTSPHLAGGADTRIPLIILHSGSFVFLFKAWNGDVNDFFAMEWDGNPSDAWTGPVQCTTFSTVSSDVSANLIGACVDASDRVHCIIAGNAVASTPPVAFWDIIYTPGVGFGSPILILADSDDDQGSLQVLNPVYKSDTDEIVFTYIGHPAPVSYPNSIYAVRGTPSSAPVFTSTLIASDANYNGRRSRILASPSGDYSTLRIVYPSGEDVNFYPNKIIMATDSGSGWSTSTIWDLTSDPAPVPGGLTDVGMDGPASATQTGGSLYVLTIADGDFQSGTIGYFQVVSTAPGSIVYNEQGLLVELDFETSTWIGPLANSSDLWLGLRPNSNGPARQVMGWFKSTDSGATWAEQDSANAPVFGASDAGAAQSVPVAFPFVSSGSTASVDCSITIVGGALALACGSPPSGLVGVTYTHLLVTTGGVSPFTYVLVSGALPTGLALDPTTGLISGLPSAAGSFIFRVRVTDANGSTADVTCTIYIASPGGNCPCAPEDPCS